MTAAQLIAWLVAAALLSWVVFIGIALFEGRRSDDLYDIEED